MASAASRNHGPDLGRLAMSHINGRAGWRKSPSPDLARGRDGVTARLTLQSYFEQSGEYRRSGGLSITPFKGLKMRGAGSEQCVPYRCARNVPNNSDTPPVFSCKFHVLRWGPEHSRTPVVVSRNKSVQWMAESPPRFSWIAFATRRSLPMSSANSCQTFSSSRPPRWSPAPE